MKIVIYFFCFAQNTFCEYSLEPPNNVGSSEYTHLLNEGDASDTEAPVLDLHLSISDDLFHSKCMIRTAITK